eukprot:XP_025012620.1 probable aldo-keto reductase 1 [Ricinus communis]
MDIIEQALVQENLIPRVKLRNQGLEVSKLGFECTVLSGLYNYPLTDEEEIPIIMHAFSKVITFFDTTNIYGENANESLVGKALKQLPRDKIQVATKFGMLKIGPDGLVVCGRPKYVGESSEASLKRLDVQYIDLYYQHLLRTRATNKTRHVDDNTSPLLSESCRRRFEGDCRNRK